MRRNLISLAVAALAAAGCAQEIVETDLSGALTFKALLESPDTKMILDYDERVSKWSGEEYISVLDGQVNHTFMTTLSVPSAEADFVCVSGTTEVSSDVVAVYPSGNYTLDKDNLIVSGVNVPRDQGVDKDTYYAYAPVSIAYTSDKTLQFKNAVSLIRFKVEDAGVWAMELKTKGGETLTGVHSLAWNNADPTFILTTQGEGAEAYDYVKAWMNGQRTFAAGEYYYLAVLPGEYSGFALSLNNVVVRTIDEAVTLERNRIYELKGVALPEAKSWGVSGTMTGWADGADLVPVEEGDWYVYKDVTIGMLDRFQFRADGQWVRQLGYEGLVKAGVEYSFDGKINDILAYEPGIYDIYLAKSLKSFKLEKVGDPAGAPAERAWGVCGSMNGWGTSDDYTMTPEGNLYVATGVEIRTSDAFKFRVGNGWDINLGGVPTGGEEDVTILKSMPYQLISKGSNIYVEESGVYDIYMSRYEDAFRIIRTGDVSDEDEGDDKKWGIVGVVNNWGEGTEDISMVKVEEGLYVAYSIVLPDGGFKIRANNVWTGEANYGLAVQSDVVVDHYYPIITSNASADMIAVAGTYDIWLDLRDSANPKVYLMTPGKDISQASEGTVVEPETSNWYLVGNFNGWKLSDPDYMMTKEDGWYVFKNFVADGKGVKFNVGAWTVNRGGVFVAEGFQVVQDGADIFVPAGTYDVYLNEAADMAYFLSPGSRP